ncbi:MAG: hypothetical protein KIS89_00365 [Dokdonella sp.]|nr:hypothetical protein [Dokdonella sp.]
MAPARASRSACSPQRDATHLLELARVRLERIALPAPVYSLALQVDELPPLTPPHRDLFDTRAQGGLDWPAGRTPACPSRRRRAARLACVADHRPTHAWRHTPLDPAAPATRDATAPAPTANRPFWLLPQPLVLRTAPQRILAGPERIESGWWDAHDQRRDYYVVELRGGQRAWAFTEAGSRQHWTLHGWFA